MLNSSRYPKISIVTPSYNQGKYLSQTIESVVSQNYPNLEYVVVDGKSEDNSVETIKKYAHLLKVWISEEDDGHGDALNKGFSHTTGEIMAWINSDDLYTPWCFQVVAEIFSRFPHVMWITGLKSWWNDSGAMTGAKRGQKNIFDFLLGNYAWIQQESVFWRRELWEKAGGYINTDYNLMIDGELWTRFFLHADLYSVDCVLGGYRVHSENRARLNYSDCLNEMDLAISVMKESCLEDTLYTYSNLDFYRNLKNCRYLKGIFLPSLYRNLIASSAFMRAAYKNINYQNGMWVERALPYSL